MVWVLCLTTQVLVGLWAGSWDKEQHSSGTLPPFVPNPSMWNI